MLQGFKAKLGGGLNNVASPSSSAYGSPSRKLTSRKMSMASSGGAEEDETLDQLSMEEFGNMMDTLGERRASLPIHMCLNSCA